ncbi:MAG TPA: GGDEF domain-containing protein [Desulfobacteraceae bacterium]|nr:GGDEF domain-containing protein [Desulfobacteraceae bacterium]|tara:strand:- start:1523 stop:2569 length:1047 start_codon:yes stop_codon:yes gene_type:complete
MFDHIYQDSVEESGTHLRLALKQIARHQLPYNPICYAVWYEYATGRNEALNLDIKTLEERNTQIGYDTILKFFRSYIADEQSQLAEIKTTEFKTILGEITRHLGSSGRQIDKNGANVESFSGRLVNENTAEEVRKISKGILSETKSIIHQSNSLKQEMDDTITEIDALKKELEGVKRAAKTDMLTGLLNRRGLDEAMARTLDYVNKNQIPLTIIIADIDHFKQVNDTHGHLIGDNVLRMLAKLLKEHIEAKDIAARFGGEEFILILPETALKEAFVLAEKIRLSLKGRRWINKNTGQPIGAITISLGVAEYQAGESLPDLIERADNALYQAKDTGRNKTVTELDIETA